ncbi:MAG: DUF1289 domain-containing protein [Psychrosphaera sp.]|nr:DUF1289 domain-containing protein [Psychrosphaera sp.]
MQQLELLSIENPCINVCQTDNRGYCSGCFRSRDERFDWAKMTPQQKRQVIELCKKRGQRRKAKAKKQQQQYQQNEKQIPITAVQANETESAQSESKRETIEDMGLDLFDL